MWHVNLCGHVIKTSEFASCSNIPAITLLLFLQDSLESSIMQVPRLDDLPLFTSKAEAGVTFLIAVRKKLVRSPRVCQVNQFVEIARPLAQDMKLLKSSMNPEFNQPVLFKMSYTLKVLVFSVSTVVHLFFMFFCHQFDLGDRFFSKWSEKKGSTKPFLQFPKETCKELFAIFSNIIT